jgi:diguanylate cyclase (GGDEF)-like protein/PAS domain S-box-containing protein
MAITFFRLQKASTELAESLKELEFHKYAIDEHAIVSITDVKGTILYANKKFCAISQYSHDELIGQNHRIVKSDLHDDAYFKDMWRTIAHNNIWHGVFANRAKDGSIYWVDSTVLPRIGHDGKPYQYIGIRTDITAQKKAEQKVQLLARFPAENPDPVMRVDEQGTLVFANSASKIILGHWQIQLNDRLPDDWRNIILRTLLNGESEEHELKISNIYYSILFTPIQSEQYINLYAHDISAIKHAEKHLNYQATHDLLTSLNNRYAFEMELEDTLIETQQSGSSSILLYIDLDQFKIVNDTCGHIAGDELLRQISHLFEEAVRDSDILARLGGDEFGIILNKCELAYGEQIAADILNNLRGFRFLWGDKSFEVGASIGLVEINSQSDSIVTLMGDADVACYAAKDAGRNRLQVFRNDRAVAQHQEEIQWASRIPTALSQNQFELFAQLIKPLSPTTDSKRHYELLIRLRDENGELIPPGAFIPAAERYNLMQSIDFWVVTQSIEMLGRHIQNFPDSNLRIGVNLSGQSIGNEHLLDYIPELLQKYALDPAFVTFEITKTAAISNLTTAIKFIHQLKQNGHFFALDYFGSVLSSFSYLKNLPVDFLKIDGAFVKDILHDPIDAAMVQAINQIGHVMNIGTIAEFVENEEVEKRLKLIGIDYAQGYHIERPRPFAEVLEQDALNFQALQNPA